MVHGIRAAKIAIPASAFRMGAACIITRGEIDPDNQEVDDGYG
jgi:hypothetical protein